MKKSLAILLTFLYLTFSVGLVITSHFCNTTLYDTSVFKEPKSCCSGNDSEKQCCHDSVSILRIDSSYDNSNPTFQNLQSHIVAAIGYVFFPDQATTDDKISNVALDIRRFRHTGKYPIYLSNRVFII